MLWQNMQAKANGILQYFTVKTRPATGNDEGESFVCCTDDCPEWIHEMIRTAHGESFPDDWIYATIRDCIETVAEENSEESALESIEEHAPSCYTADLLRWVLEDLSRKYDVDDAIRDGAETLDAAIMQAQTRAACEIFTSVLSSITEIIDAETGNEYARHEKNCEIGHAWVDAVHDSDGKMEDLDYPAFRQMLANANAPVWPTFDNPVDEQTAIEAAYEYWCDIVNEERRGEE